ncbi:DivIVA domain-containing protein [Planifilum fimeticola]|uniref:DivIVA domain-containing protein n=1 Tax=Planifilum fimeticola TaxID=201975 RepID=A0A2T0LA04_9BACL|nr:DivIVA domain-containing protein [Planifilum fimeticola]
MKRLTPMDIFNKDFKHAIRGYDIDEVNEFLDLVIKNYEDLIEENERLKEQLRKAQRGGSSRMVAEDPGQNAVIRDLTRRVERLEQVVFRQNGRGR